MRLVSVSFRGLTRFTSAEPVTIDLDALGPGLIALVGRNGEGKTTAMEAVAAALYKKLPSRPGSLYEHAHGRDAFVEATFTDESHELKARVQIDTDRRTIESYLFQGGKALTTGRSAEFEALVARHFGTYELFLSSVFNAQNRAGSFLLMPKAERKALFVELLGLDYLERLHVQARDRAGAAEGNLRGARALLAQAEAETAGLPDAEKALAASTAQDKDAGLRLHQAKEAEHQAAQKVEEARAAEERIKALWKDVEAAATGKARAETDLRAAEAEPGKVREEEARQLRALAAQNPDALEVEAKKRYAAAEDRLTRRREALRSLIEQAPAIRQAQRDVEGLHGEAELLRAAAKTVEDLQAEHRLAETWVTMARKAHIAAFESNEGARRDLERRAGLLEQAPCTRRDRWHVFRSDTADPGTDLAGTCPLLADAREAQQRAAVLVTTDHSGVDVAVAGRDRLADDVQNASLACDPIRLAEIDAQLPGLRETASKATALEHAEEQARGVEDELAQAVATLESDLAAALEAFDKVSKLREEAKARAAQAQILAAQAIAAAVNTHDTACAAHQTAHAAWERGQAGRPSIVATSLQLEDARGALHNAEDALLRTTQASATAAARVDRLREVQANAEKLAAQTRGTEDELGDWNLLAKALGRDGVQALEIDAAGPEVAKLVNELLAACYGARFSVAFETLREKKSKAGEFAEAFDVRVFDQGRERPVEALSGGERVIVGEAVGLSIGIFNARKSGVQWRTLFRDETAGALDPDNAEAYVLMLRRALALGGFHQVLFVSHQEAVWERADARLHVADGKVTPEGAGRAPLLEAARA